jgi:hypothetical protein
LELVKVGNKSLRVCEFEMVIENYPSKLIEQKLGLPFINAGHLSSDGLIWIVWITIQERTFNLLGGGKIKR